MNVDPQGCPMLPLAASALGQVAVCPNCNVITVTVQSISLRFEPPAFDELARMVGQARAALLRLSFASASANSGAAPDSAPGSERERPH